MINSLTFPILALKRNDIMVYAFPEKKKVTRTTIQLLDKGVFNKTIFIDSRGEQFAIVQVIKKDWATFLWGYSLLWKGRLINIDFELRSIGKINLEELREMLKNKVEKNPAYYYSEILPRINAAPGYQTLFRIFF